MKASRALFIAIPLCLASQNAAAAPRAQPAPAIFTDLLKCRTITDDKQRLACFDQQVGAMESASQRDEVVVLDKAELHKTRRTLFGFSFPKLPFLGGGDDGEKKGDASEDMSRIDAVIATARSVGYGKWQIGLEDGAQWITTEAITTRDPKPGMKIEIKRAAMGSFMGKIDDGRAVRMKRIG
ncbi:MAG: hypothetical protein PSY12_09990 [bacterium]|nr:hypothetical protein [bacterium]